MDTATRATTGPDRHPFGAGYAVSSMYHDTRDSDNAVDNAVDNAASERTRANSPASERPRAGYPGPQRASA